MGTRLRTLGAVLAVALLLGGAAWLQSLREVVSPTSAASEDVLYLTSGAALRRLTVGYSALAADLYWIRAIQYYGGVKLHLQGSTMSPGETGNQPLEYTQLYPMLDITTTLDPYFNIAYRFGAIFLAEPYPGGAGRPDLAIKLLEKGLAARPDKWEYMQDIGFVHYWWRHDYQAAAGWFDRASKVEGAPWFLRSLAANTLSEGGDRRSSRTMWESIRESAEIEWLRTDAERRLKQLDAADFIELVQTEVDRAKARGLPATSWQELVRAGGIRGVPVDPERVPLELDPSGTVSLSRQSPLFPLPLEPQRAFAPPSR
jgi:hypothetical protein